MSLFSSLASDQLIFNTMDFNEREIGLTVVSLSHQVKVKMWARFPQLVFHLTQGERASKTLSAMVGLMHFSHSQSLRAKFNL